MGSLQEFNGFPPGNLQCNTAVSAILMGAPCALMGSKGTLMGSWREHWAEFSFNRLNVPHTTQTKLTAVCI